MICIIRSCQLPFHSSACLWVQGEVLRPLPLYFGDEGICVVAALLLQQPVTCHHRNSSLERHQENPGQTFEILFLDVKTKNIVYVSNLFVRPKSKNPKKSIKIDLKKIIFLVTTIKNFHLTNQITFSITSSS